MLLSVIVPIYNTEPYLKQCIDSILAQRVSDMEIILVDDGSTDGSGAICDEYAQKHNKVKVIHKENSGVQDARLLGAESALGKYITFVDSDDWIKDTMYEELLSLIQEKNVDMIESGIFRYYDAEHIVEDLPIEEGYYSQEEIRQRVVPYMIWSKKNKKLWNFNPSFGTKIIKKEFVLKYLMLSNPLNIYALEDPVVTYPMMLELNSMVVTNRSYYFHRSRPKGSIASYISDPQFIDKLYRAYHYLWECFAKSGYGDILQEPLERLFLLVVQERKVCYEKRLNTYPAELFPFEKVSREHKVILYGAGTVGRKLKQQNEQYNFCNIVAWVDKKYDKLPGEMKVVSPEKIDEIIFDYVIIAVFDEILAEEILQDLLKRGVSKKKILWERFKRESFMEE